MSLTDTQKEQINLYGQLLEGNETELQLAQIQRVYYLKQKFRPKLEILIGDTPDNLTDAVRAIILGQAIALGIETDQNIIDGYKQYIEAMYEGYGGGLNMLQTIAYTAAAIQQEVVNGYFVSKSMIMQSDDIDYINSVDLYGELSETGVI